LQEIGAIWREDGAALNPHLGKTGLVFALLLSIGVLL
jgi:hypothetical protein